MKTCSSCGGSFNESLPKCPFCGTLNAEGAEKDYKKKLYKIRKELDQVDELAVDNYKNEVRLFFKVFLITAAIIGLFALMIWRTAGDSAPDSFGLKRNEMDKTIVEVRAAHDEFLKFEALFEEGRYEELSEAFSASPYRGKFYEWKHYRFVNCYLKIKECNEELDALKSDSSFYKYYNILYDYTTAVNDVENDKGYTLSDDDKDLLLPKIALLKDRITDKTGLTEGELADVVSRATKKGYVDSTGISDYAKERWGKE